ncbi:MAG: IPTL-CTERM sorting domain-containing protein [Acidobacteriota bacterium]
MKKSVLIILAGATLNLGGFLPSLLQAQTSTVTTGAIPANSNAAAVASSVVAVWNNGSGFTCTQGTGVDSNQLTIGFGTKDPVVLGFDVTTPAGTTDRPLKLKVTVSDPPSSIICSVASFECTAGLSGTCAVNSDCDTGPGTGDGTCSMGASQIVGKNAPFTSGDLTVSSASGHPVPTLSEWGMGVLVLLLMGVFLFVYRRNRTAGAGAAA